jgi:hypothetical protein
MKGERKLCFTWSKFTEAVLTVVKENIVVQVCHNVCLRILHGRDVKDMGRWYSVSFLVYIQSVEVSADNYDTFIISRGEVWYLSVVFLYGICFGIRWSIKWANMCVPFVCLSSCTPNPPGSRNNYSEMFS